MAHCLLKQSQHGKGSYLTDVKDAVGDGFAHRQLTSKSSVRRCCCSSRGMSFSTSSIQAGVAVALGVRRRRNTWYISCSALRPYLHKLSHRCNAAVKGTSEAQQTDISTWESGSQ